MTIYNLNLLVGYVSTGVDYAQAYRAQILRAICDQKYLFLEVPQYRELGYYTRIGIAENEILVLPFLFAGAGSIFPALPFDRVKAQVLPDDSEYSFTEEEGARRFTRADRGESIVFCMTDRGFVHTVEYFFRNTLIKKEHYSDRLLFTEYLTLEKSEARIYVKVCRIDYYNDEGHVGLREFRTGDERVYVLPDLTRYTTLQLFERFLKTNRFSGSDIFLLDRINPHLPALLRYRGRAKLVLFMHSKLTFTDYSDSHHWKGVNYEYTDLVRNAEQFDYILTSTQEQADEVRDWFKKEYGRSVKTCAIPAGGMKEHTYPSAQRQRHGLVTVSRLDHRKRVDLLIKAVAKARKSITDLTLDIYGEGPKKDVYGELIAACGAQEYIRLMGYVHNFDRYAQYEGYISASIWETFGLTLLEAMSAGLPLIGLDVPYGNRSFIHPGENGYLIPYENGQPDEVTTEGIAAAIQDLFGSGDLNYFSASSYSGAAKYSVGEIRNKWVRLLKYIGEGDSDRITG